MERMFNKQSKRNQQGAPRESQPRFASLTAGLMARKGEAVPAPAHLDGVSIHSHGVARQPETVAEHNLSQPAREPMYSGNQPETEMQPAPAPHFEPPQPQAEQPTFGARHVPRSADPEPATVPEVETEVEPDPQPVMRETPVPVPPQADEPVPAPEEVLRSRALRRATVSTGDCCSLPMPAAVTETLPPGPYAKVTTRLDRERVRKLKILAARMETTNQKVLLAALDHYLDYACDVLAAECPCLARSLREDQ